MAQRLRPAPMQLQGILGGVPDQSPCVAHFVHHRVADVGTGTATNALILQALANIDTRGAHLDAQAAVHTGTQAQRSGICLARAGTTRLTALFVIGDDECVLVKHCALEAGVGAHVLAYLLTHEPSVAIGCKTVEQGPENFPRPHVHINDFGTQFLDGREIAHKGKPSPQRNRKPCGVFRQFAPELADGQRPGIPPHAGRAIAFDPFFYPEKDLCVNRLRASIATPQPPCYRRE